MQKVSFYIASNNDIDFNSVKIIRTHEPCVPTRGKAIDFNSLVSEANDNYFNYSNYLKKLL